ncbi:MAG: YicC family protein [Alphaproteobacteria bacterium]|nr:YicC family protein [Alphaproteobacteria bacterium]
MTGFARATGTFDPVAFSCEVRTVNARGLDIRLRLAAGLDGLEASVRRLVSARFSRGSLSLSVAMTSAADRAQISVNEPALAAVLAAMADISERVKADPPRLDAILALKGVLETSEPELSASTEKQVHGAILDTIERALDDLVSARRVEGAQLGEILGSLLDEIETLTAAAKDHPARTRSAILARLQNQIAELMENQAGLSEDRLHLEALVLATKADIREELDRLKVHVSAARDLLAGGGPIGRRLDFLSQEFNREANTLCSKSNDVSLTAIGLDLKAAIDRLREQVQNLE